VLAVLVMGASSLIAAWSAFSLRHEFVRSHDRESLWRRPILTGREDLRLGALTCSSAATTCSLIDMGAFTPATADPAVAPALLSVAVTCALLSLSTRSARRLVVYRG
jgi:hypothetical protein